MSKEIFRSKSIAELLNNMGLGKPSHPLIAVIDTSKLSYGKEFVGMRFSSDLYCIALKDTGCGIDYGRNHYDFTEGALLFTSPGQVFTVRKPQDLNQSQGWMLYFHPDLIRNTTLGTKIEDYSFFSYGVHEALHLSEKEQQRITHCVQLISEEIQERIDKHTQQVIASNIELLLKYCLRYYERQFNTRSAHNTDIVSKVETLLRDYYRSDQLLAAGPPSVQFLAEKCHLSANYLSDLLKKETGKTAKDHINDFLVDKAKNLLLVSTDSISGIAYTLGFNYPHYFSRLFKRKTGVTPQEYRQRT